MRASIAPGVKRRVPRAATGRTAMSGDIVDACVRRVDALIDRRKTLAGLGLTAVAATATGLTDAWAKKNKRKRRKRRKKKRDNAPERCADRCPEQVALCVERAADSTLCADTVEAADVDDRCVPCTSDQDCLAIDPFDNPFPYCVEVDGVIDRATEEVSLALAVACGLANDAVCVSLGFGRTP